MNNHDKHIENNDRFENLISDLAAEELRERQQRASPNLCDSIMTRIQEYSSGSQNASRQRFSLPAFLRILLRPVPALSAILVVLVIMIIVQILRFNNINELEIVRFDPTATTPTILQSYSINYHGERNFGLSDNEFAVLKVRNGALHLLIRPESAGIIKDGSELILYKGAIWAFADKAAVGFSINTMHAESTITGTVFGISTSDSADSVDVLRGKIAVQVGDKQVAVQEGHTLSISLTDDGLHIIELSSNPVSPPNWAMDILKQYQQHYFLRYFPSATGNE